MVGKIIAPAPVDCRRVAAGRLGGDIAKGGSAQCGATGDRGGASGGVPLIFGRAAFRVRSPLHTDDAGRPRKSRSGIPPAYAALGQTAMRRDIPRPSRQVRLLIRPGRHLAREPHEQLDQPFDDAGKALIG